MEAVEGAGGKGHGRVPSTVRSRWPLSDGLCLAAPLADRPTILGTLLLRLLRLLLLIRVGLQRVLLLLLLLVQLQQLLVVLQLVGDECALGGGEHGFRALLLLLGGLAVGLGGGGHLELLLAAGACCRQGHNPGPVDCPASRTHTISTLSAANFILLPLPDAAPLHPAGNVYSSSSPLKCTLNRLETHDASHSHVLSMQSSLWQPAAPAPLCSAINA